jgi:hypothetical protein
MLPPSLGSKSDSACSCIYVVSLLGLFFDLEDGGDMFFRNVGLISQNKELFITTTAGTEILHIGI